LYSRLHDRKEETIIRIKNEFFKKSFEEFEKIFEELNEKLEELLLKEFFTKFLEICDKYFDFKPTERDSSSKIGIIGNGIISENKDGSYDNYDTMNEIFIDVPGLSSP